MSKTAKFNFLAEDVVVTSSRFKDTSGDWVTINPKYGSIAFSLEYIRRNNFQNMYIKFYVDKERNAIAWRTLHEDSLGGLKGYRQLKIYTGTKGQYVQEKCSLTIGKLLETLNIKKTEPAYSKLQINEYKSTSLLDGHNYHYVVLSK